ncbi:MAG TPA: hypothetical protein PKG71_01945 [Candidatus Woesebacteria bacterium]|nr:hypothetical protein [Candidatus Woesebacteria bacterium]HNS94708.1 hypothetical protein [Candidatus Woesebacteria bacterium]
MSIFVLVFALFMVGMCFVVSSPVPSTWGKRAILFVVGAALWVCATILIRNQEDVLLDFLFSDYALSGRLANQVMASLVVFGFGWFFFVAKSLRATRVEIQWGDPRYILNGSDRQWVQGERKFRPWPSLLVWIPVVALLGVVWIVPVHFAGVELKPTATATPTRTPWSTNTPTQTPTATVTPLATQTSTPTAMPTNTPTNTPEPTATQVAISTNPNMPPLPCAGGRWLHTQPVKIDRGPALLGVCVDGFVVHDIGTGWDFGPVKSALFMGAGGVRVDLEFVDGELLVNDVPFALWLATQGGR